MVTTMFQAVVLGLFIVSGAFADVVHLKNAKHCHQTETQKTDDYGNLVLAFGNHKNVAYSHSPSFSFDGKSFGLSSTRAPFEYGTQPTPAPFVFKSLQHSIPASFSYGEKSFGLSSTRAPFEYGTQPTPAPFVFKSLQHSIPASFSYGEKSFGLSSTRAPFEYGTQPTPAPFVFKSLQHSIPASFSYGEKSFGISSTRAPFEYSTQPTPVPIVLKSTTEPFVDSGSSSTSSLFPYGTQTTPTEIQISSHRSNPAPFEYSIASSTPAPFTPEDSFKSIATSNTQSTPAPFAIESQSTAVPFSFSGSSSGPAAAVSVKSTFGSHPIPVPFSYSQGSAFAQYGGHSAPSQAHEITINREIPVPYYVQIEKRIPYPVLVNVPHPYQVTVEKHVPYAVRVNVDRAVPVPSPYPVEVEKRVPYPVEKPVPYEVRVPVDRPYPVSVPFEKPVPYAVEKPVPYPVRVNVDRPYPVEKPVPYPVAVERPVPYAVEKPVPYPVEKPVPYPVEKQIPYPVKYEVPVKVPVPVQVKVPVNVDRPVPYPVEKRVPYPVAVPYEVKVPVPVRSPAERFATVHYYQQSPIVVQQESYKSYTSGSTAAPVTDNHIVQSSFVSESGPAVSNYAGLDYTKSNNVESGLVQENGSYGFDQQSFYGSTTPVPSSTAGYKASSSSPQYESSDFDSVAQQVSSISGSVQTGSDYAGSDYTKFNSAGSGLSQQSGSYNFDQQQFYGSTTPVPSSIVGSTEFSPSSQYQLSDFNSAAQQVGYISGSVQTGSDYIGSDYSKSNYAGKGQAQESGSYGFGQQSFYGSKIPVPSSLPQSKSSNTDSSNQQVVSIGGSRKTESNIAGSDYTRSNYAGSGQAQESDSYNFNQQAFYGSKTPASSSKAEYTKSSSSPQYESSNFGSVNQQINSVGGSAAADYQQSDNLDVGKK